MPKKTPQRSLEQQNRDAYFRSTTAPGPLALEVKDEVGYSRYFLKQIGVPATDPMWRKVGKVEAIDGPFVTVRWSEGETSRVNSANLAKPGPNTRWCD